MVIWPTDAASLCFVTYNKAKAEKIHGTKVQLTITKLGGSNEKLVSHRYQVPLLNQYGKTVFIEAYGIYSITSDIQSANLDGVIYLFKGGSIEEA